MKIILILIIFKDCLFGFLNDVNVGAKQQSMGISGVADIEDLFSAWWNPSSIGLNDKISVGAFLNFNETIPDYLLSSFAIKMNKPINWGLLVVNESVNEVISQNRYILTIGKNILSKFALGINIKILHLIPAGYQENPSDSSLKSIIKFQYDLGILFKIFSNINFGFLMRDLIRNYDLNKINTKYVVGIYGSFNIISFNTDLYWTENNFNISFGIQKDITKNIILRAGLNRMNPSWGCEIKFPDMFFAKLLSFQYSNSQLLGSNHSLSLQINF